MSLLSKSISSFTGSTTSLAQKSLDASSLEIPKARNYVSSLFNGLRNRKWNLRGHGRQRTNSQSLISEKDYNDDSVSISSISKKEMSDKNNNTESNEIFEDAEVNFLCEDKEMARELYYELPVHERKQKLEEEVSRIGNNQAC